MNQNKNNIFFEYLSLILVISYIFVHNILLVLIGVSISLYLINIDFINSYRRSINKFITNDKKYKDFNKIHKKRKDDSKQFILAGEDSKLTLVDTIEELGFIPSLNKFNDTEA